MCLKLEQDQYYEWQQTVQTEEEKILHSGQICLQYPCEWLHNIDSIYCAVTFRLNSTINLSPKQMCEYNNNVVFCAPVILPLTKFKLCRNINLVWHKKQKQYWFRTNTIPGECCWSQGRQVMMSTDTVRKHHKTFLLPHLLNIRELKFN